MDDPKFCRDCKWSKPEERSEWNLRCHHRIINRHDAWALSAAGGGKGTDCHNERSKSWPAKCGMRGALWEPKE